MNINLNIERLVLDGLPLNRFEAEQMKGAVELELSHLLSEDALAPHLLSGGAYPSLRVGEMGILASSPESLGKQVAQTIHGGINK